MSNIHITKIRVVWDNLKQSHEEIGHDLIDLQ